MSDQTHHGECILCDSPIRDIAERVIVAETPPDDRDRDDHGTVRVAHKDCNL